MSIDKSLRRKNSLQRTRNVLTRAERIVKMLDEDRFGADRSPYGLPKTKVVKVVLKKAKKKEEKAGEEAAAAGAGATPAAAPAAATAAAKTPAAKGGGKK
jgi:small basic protein (TIGR04137 family)